MIHVVIGGSGSGKSQFAESLFSDGLRKENVPLLYVATMIPYGPETLEKIRRHRAMRAGRGFVSMDCYRNLSELEIPKNRGILLECISNLTANELFAPGSEIPSEKQGDLVEEKILAGVRYLSEKTEHLVIVTNDLNGDGIRYDAGTEQYKRCVGKINQGLFRMADRRTEVVFGIPVEIGET